MEDRCSTPTLPGALVISLDFELRWGVRERDLGDYDSNLMGARLAVPRILELFAEFDTAATWATVGFLFASTLGELRDVSPTRRPQYKDARLNPYNEQVGENEAEDPLHFGSSLVDRIRATPRQEIGSHTFSHFYCQEPGQDREAFRADLEAARAIASRKGLRLRSIVFPRNQHNPAYDALLLENGITAFRGNPRSYAWQFADTEESRALRRRSLRFLDAYIDLTDSGTYPWSEIPQSSGLSNVRASYPLRPYHPRLRKFEALRARRIRRSLQDAARRRQVFHLWWHPHNFGAWTEENLMFLTEVLKEANRLARSEGMLSLTMAEAADLARQTCGETRMGRPGPA